MMPRPLPSHMASKIVNTFLSQANPWPSTYFTHCAFAFHMSELSCSINNDYLLLSFTRLGHILAMFLSLINFTV